MPSYTLPGGTIKFQSTKVNGRYPAVAAGGGGASALSYSISGGRITLTTDGTYSWGTKPISDKPNLVWRADDGEAPNSTYGNASTWGDGSTTFSGVEQNITTTRTTDGQSSSLEFDHGNSSGPLLPMILVGSQRKKMAFIRKYEDYDTLLDKAIRTRIEKPLVSGSLPSPGDTVTGDASGATGIVLEAGEESTRFYIYYENTGGTINDDPPTDFQYDELMTWPSGSGTNSEGTSEFPTGTYRTFNHKIFRIWPQGGPGNYPNVILGSNDDIRTTTELPDGRLIEENNSFTQPDFKERWSTDIYLYAEATANDVADGWIKWWKDQYTLLDGSPQMVTRTAENPNDQVELFFTQVSNGAQPNSITHADYVYVDDSHYFVALRDDNSGLRIPIPVDTTGAGWTNNQIDAHDFTAMLPNWTHIEVYVDGVLEGSVAR